MKMNPKMLNFKWICLLPLLFVGTMLQAQNAKKAKKLWTLAQTYKLTVLDSFVDIGVRAIQAESDTNNKNRDDIFIFNAYLEIGKYSYDSNYFKYGGYYLHEAYLVAKDLKRIDLMSKVFPVLFANDYYREANIYSRSDGSYSYGREYGGSYWEDSMVWNGVRALSVQQITKDSFRIKLAAGSFFGLVKNSYLWHYTSFSDTSMPDRQFKNPASGMIDSIDEYYSYGYVKVDSQYQNNKMYNYPLQEDIFFVKYKLQGDFINNVLSTFARYRIFIDATNSDAKFVSGHANFRYPTKYTEPAIILAMKEDLIAEAVKLEKNNNPEENSKLELGRFSGKSLSESYRLTTELDIRICLDYILTYYTSICNQRFSFVKLYNFWLKKGTPLPSKYSRLVDMMDFSDSNRLGQLREDFGYYFSNMQNKDSVFCNRFIKAGLSSEKKAFEQFKNYYHFKQSLNDSFNYPTFFYYFCNYAYTVRKPQYYVPAAQRLISVKHKLLKLETLDSALVAWGYLYTAGYYSRSSKPEIAINYADSCISYLRNRESYSVFQIAHNHKGYNQLRLGRIKESYPNILKAYELDSSNYSITTNLGNWYFQKGNKSLANYYLKKGIAQIRGESSWDAVIEAWNNFITADINKDDYAKLKEELTSYYIQNQRAKALSDSCYDIAKLYYSNYSDYANAADFFRKSAELYSKAVEIDYNELRMRYRYAGYCYYNSNDNYSSKNCYINAAAITEKYLNDDELLAQDYEDVANVYEKISNSEKEAEYRIKYNSAYLRNKEKTSRKTLHTLVVTFQSSWDSELQKAKSDAQNIYTLLKQNATNYFDTAEFRFMEGDSAKRDRFLEVLKEIAAKSDENDVFCIYFSGGSLPSSKEKHARIEMEDHYLNFQSVLNSLSIIPARKQIHIWDCNDLNLEEYYTPEKYSPLKDPQRSTIYLGMNKVRIESDSGSFLAKALVNGFQNAYKDGVLHAGNWISESIAQLSRDKMYYPVDYKITGYDFVLSKKNEKLTSLDTIVPKIELFGAIKTRAENIQLISGNQEKSGIIIDQSPLAFVKINGVKISVQSNGRFTVPVTMQGLQSFVIEAMDLASNYSRVEFKFVNIQNELKKGGKKYAYFIATDNYVSWEPLSNPIFDAEQLAAEIHDNFDFDTIILRNPSKENIITVLAQIRKRKYEIGDQVFVFLAGHGYLDTIDGTYYVCNNAPLVRGDMILETAPFLSQRNILSDLNKAGCTNIMVAIDICYGGSEKSLNADNAEESSIGSMSPDEYYNKMLNTKCRIILTSAGNEPAKDNGGAVGSHNDFVDNFLKHLRNQKLIDQNNGFVYSKNLYSACSKSKQDVKYNTFGGDLKGEFIFKQKERKVMFASN